MSAKTPQRPPMPDALARRPFDERRNLPVPYMNMTYPDGPDAEPVIDFTAIWGPAVMDCLENRLCGICGTKLGYWIAFLGGPRSEKSRMYIDSPFHEECAAAAALGWCPHIAIKRHKRATDQHVGEDAWSPTDADLNKGDEWVMGITRDYTIKAHQGAVVSQAAPFKRTRRFRYDDNGDVYEVKR
jgi:hypothetical protein